MIFVQHIPADVKILLSVRGPGIDNARMIRERESWYGASSEDLTFRVSYEKGLRLCESGAQCARTQSVLGTRDGVERSCSSCMRRGGIAP